VGCLAPCQCLNGTPIFGQVVGYLCLQACNGTSDSAACVNPTDTCVQTPDMSYYCYTNACGPAVGFNGNAYYGLCSAQGTNDGTCIPWYTANLGILGYCVQAGTAAPAGPCSPSRSDGGPGSLCRFDSFCLQGADGGSLCAPMCAPDGGVSASPDGGYSASCAAGSTCVATSGLQGSEDGACLSTCINSASCSAPLTCQGGFCLPQ
jgi:hypothetical protein